MAGTKKIKVNAVLTTYEILLKDKVCRLSFFFLKIHIGVVMLLHVMFMFWMMSLRRVSTRCIAYDNIF